MEDEPGGADRFQRKESFSALQDDDPFLGEEDYEDYDDLYNDVNVGEGFRQSVPRRDDEGFSSAEKKMPLPQHLPPPQQQPPPPQLPPLPPGPAPMMAEKVNIPGIAGEMKAEGGGGVFPNVGYREASEQVNLRAPAMSNVGGVRPDLGQFGGKAGETKGQYGNPNHGSEAFARQGGVGSGNVAGSGAAVGGPTNYNASGNGGTTGGGSGSGGTILFVGDLHWWTTDADLEGELCRYGQVKEVKFFDEKASGKSKGYCQVEFYDPMAAAACKDGMNGHVFNGRPCVVAFASPYSIRRMGEAHMSKNQSTASQSASTHGGRGRVGSGIPTGANYGGGRGGGNWGRGGAAGGRGQMGNMRNRMGQSGGRGIMGNGGMMNPPPPPPVLNHGNMFGQGFDPSGYGAMVGRMGGGYGGFPGGPAAPPFTGMMPSFPTMVSPHVNPAFFGRGIAPGGVGMWPDPNAGGWGVEEQSSYGDDAASDHQYGEGSHGKADKDWSGAPERKRRDDRERDVTPGYEPLERRHHEDREMGHERERDREREKDRERERERERDRYRDDRERHSDHYRHKERESYRDGDWDRGRLSRARSKSRESEYSKRRRATP